MLLLLLLLLLFSPQPRRGTSTVRRRGRVMRGTLSRMDAATQPTRMYLRRVPRITFPRLTPIN
ncbi:hypothetical protein ABB28_17250 [Stenotrophomonas chelatiphaga]|uniref:Secreted protein n=1 Tax=Stenotrophomonas chelatiphaga TaxID=517011 RepID=A0A0R0CMY5_9GAMM|nr:hypothetical protein ABB28_17250 [Stenotrophomonas chelatiphaga]